MFVNGFFDSTGVTDPTTDSTPWYAAPLTALTSIYQQKTLMDINVERARQGLAPIDQSAFAPTVNVGLPPDQMKQIMMLAGLAVLALYLNGRRK